MHAPDSFPFFFPLGFSQYGFLSLLIRPTYSYQLYAYPHYTNFRLCLLIIPPAVLLIQFHAHAMNAEISEIGFALQWLEMYNTLGSLTKWWQYKVTS